MKCTLNKKQNVGMPESSFKIRLNKHRNDVEYPHPKTILACKHFKENKSCLQQTCKIHYNRQTYQHQKT